MASIAATRSTHVRARSREVVSYHKDDARPGKPLHVLIPGGLVALGAFAGMFMTAWVVWVSEALPSAEGIQLILLLLVPYFGGLLLFSYGYELYDWPRTLRLALIAGAIGLAVILVFFTIAYIWRILLAGGAGAAGSRSSSSGNSDSDSGGSSSGSSSRGSDSPLSLNFRNIDFSLGKDESSTPTEQPIPAGHCPKCGMRLVAGPGSPCPVCDPARAG